MLCMCKTRCDNVDMDSVNDCMDIMDFDIAYKIRHDANLVAC